MYEREAQCKYLKKGFWNQPENQFWRDGKIEHTEKGIRYIEKALNVKT